MKESLFEVMIIDLLMRCMPIALQLAGACVVINAMSMVGSIDDILNHAKVIATIPHDESPRIYLNKEMVQMSIEKNIQQIFSAVYIISGYLTAVIMADNPPSGYLDASAIAVISFVLWKIARVTAIHTASKNADRVRSIPRGEKTRGVKAYKKVGDNSVFR